MYLKRIIHPRRIQEMIDKGFNVYSENRLEEQERCRPEYIEHHKKWSEPLIENLSHHNINNLYYNGYMFAKKRISEDLRRDLMNDALNKKGREGEISRPTAELNEKILDDRAIKELIGIMHKLWPQYKLYDIAYNIRAQNEKVGSEFWHRDGGFHKYKMYIVIDRDKESTTTEILPITHFLPFWFSEWEMYHVKNSITKPDNQDYERDIEKTLRKTFIANVKLAGNPGEVFMFDTNIIHKGSDQKKIKARPRITVMLEFIHSDAEKILSRIYEGGRLSSYKTGMLINEDTQKKNQHIILEDRCTRKNGLVVYHP